MSFVYENIQPENKKKQKASITVLVATKDKLRPYLLRYGTYDTIISELLELHEDDMRK